MKNKQRSKYQLHWRWCRNETIVIRMK